MRYMIQNYFEMKLVGEFQCGEQIVGLLSR